LIFGKKKIIFLNIISRNENVKDEYLIIIIIIIIIVCIQRQ
jgi:hypothetical protein